MTEPATPDTIRDTAETLKCAAFLDDRMGGADLNRIKAWADQVERHKLGREDLLKGLQRFYDGPQDRPIGVGDLIHHARVCRRERNEREEAHLRDSRAEALERKAAADETHVLAAGFVAGPVEQPTSRLTQAEAALQSCHGKAESMAAIAEFFAAKREAKKAGMR